MRIQIIIILKKMIKLLLVFSFISFIIFCGLAPSSAVKSFSTLKNSLRIPRALQSKKNGTSFEIDYENNQFLLDGKPFRYVSGSFHYFRAPHQKWRDILKKMRQGGLNAVSTYVEWSLHEPNPGKWNWEGDANIVEFIKIAQEEDLLVILRPGPYICAERDFGGLPYWLLKIVPNIKIRTNHERYMFYAKRFMNQILNKVKHLLRGNGGPIIMVQVENEYGSFYACHNDYKNEMHKVFQQHVGNNAVLFTTDGPTRKMLQCGTIPGVYATVDFGSSANILECFRIMREFSPKGPLVNSEYYPGWLSHWNETFQRVSTENVAKSLNRILSLNASVNLYMYFGGTNFAYTSGANINNMNGKLIYQPDLTSYDYDAPLDEAGDPTPKYFEIRKVISKYLPLPSVKTPTPYPKGKYGTINMSPTLDLFTKEGRTIFGIPQQEFSEPPTFEHLGLPNYLVLYEANLPKTEKSKDIVLKAITKDRALVYIDNALHGTFNRMNMDYSMPLPNNKGKQIKLLVESMGRVNFGSVDVEDFKGVWNATYNGIKISPWKVTGYRLDSITGSDFKVKSTRGETGELSRGPQFLSGQFKLDGEPLDTYLNTAEWGKGVAYVNGHNLGRYWPSVGPQVTLYVPAAYLKKGTNSLVLLELENVPKARTISFEQKPILDYPADIN